ncbi:MAG TPA: hypothetical protein VER55_01890 [Ardenticatenaceae bacterium]|nr:hypothetical protein [Ardenticatenaceae bacterium]
MDPITFLVQALVAGAASAIKPAAAQAVKDAYAAVKSIIQRKYSGVDLGSLEKNPASAGRQEVVQEELATTEAGADQELLQEVKRLVEAVEQHAPAEAAAVGVDLERIKGAALRIADVRATGTGVRVRDAELTGDIEIKGVQAGQGPSNDPKP